MTDEKAIEEIMAYNYRGNFGFSCNECGMNCKECTTGKALYQAIDALEERIRRTENEKANPK